MIVTDLPRVSLGLLVTAMSAQEKRAGSATSLGLAACRRVWWPAELGYVLRARPNRALAGLGASVSENLVCILASPSLSRHPRGNACRVWLGGRVRAPSAVC